MTDAPVPTPDPSSVPPRLIDRRVWPAGVVPRHLQQWVLIGVAVVMVAILALAGPPAKPRVTSTPSVAATGVDPNQQRIEDYQRHITEQAQRLAAEQASLEAAKAALGSAAPTAATGTADGVGTPATHVPVSPTGATAPPERETREERARFADNVAFVRDAGLAKDAAQRPATTSASDAVAALLPPNWPTVAPATSAPPAPPDPTASSSPAQRAGAQASAKTAPPALGTYRVFEGTVIDTVLTNRLEGSFDGPVNCLVSVPVYADDHLVIPAGARVLGEARAVNAFGQSRLAVTFHRVRFPNGRSLSLDGVHGLNQAGDLGLHDLVDRHYGQIFGTSLALGAIAGFAQATGTVGVDTTGLDIYRQGVASNVSQSAIRILDRFLNLLPTITIREGHRIKVYLSADLDLPAYTDAVEGGRE